MDKRSGRPDRRDVGVIDRLRPATRGGQMAMSLVIVAP
jgi:hypothetical protein